MRSWLNVVLVIVALLAALLATQLRLDVDPATLEARYATGPSRFVEAGGIRFHIRDRGQGPVLVLLHGQAVNYTVWEDAALRLASTHRVVSVDLPGHGLTGPDPRERYHMAQMAESLDALMLALGLDRFALAGNSLGGGVALEYALAYPQKLDALILVDAVGAPVGEGPVPSVFSLELIPAVAPLVMWFTPPSIVRAGLADTFGNPALLTDAEVTADYELMLRAGNRNAQRQTLNAGIDPTLQSRVPSIRTPTLVLWGGLDKWIPPRDAAWFGAHLPDATVKVLEDVGHMPMLENPSASADAMAAFLLAQGA